MDCWWWGAWLLGASIAPLRGCHFAFQIEQKSVDVFFGPFFAVKPLEHASGWVFLGSVMQVI
jgi:hypothetical protein